MSIWDKWQNNNIHPLKLSGTLAIGDKCRERKKEGKKVYNLGTGQSPFPVPQTAVKNLIKYANEKIYLRTIGLETLRESISEFHLEKDDIELDPNLMLIGPGSKELIYLLQFILNRNYNTFQLLLPTPCWGSYIGQSKIINVKTKFIETKFADKYKLLPQQLLQACQESEEGPKLLILNYPGNPSGMTYTDEELKEIASVAEEFDLLVLSDEIYSGLLHSGKHSSISKFYDKTIYTNGFSKWPGGGGWRLAYFAFPESLKNIHHDMIACGSEVFTCASTPIQYAAVSTYQRKDPELSQEIDLYIERTNKILSKLGNECARILQQGNVHVHKPEGGFYLFPDFSPYATQLYKLGVKDSASLRDLILDKTGIALVPGSVFGRPPSELSARISYVNFDGESAMKACELLDSISELPQEFLQESCSETLEACEVLTKWLSQI